MHREQAEALLVASDVLEERGIQSLASALRAMAGNVNVPFYWIVTPARIYQVPATFETVASLGAFEPYLVYDKKAQP